MRIYDSFKSGLSLCGIRMDYSKDFVNGDISFFKRTYNSFYLDPTFESINLSDCSFAITRDLIDKQFAKQLLPFVYHFEGDYLTAAPREGKLVPHPQKCPTFSRKRNL